MNNKYVILDSNNKYINSVVWNGDLSVWQPPAGTTAVPADQVDPSIFNEKYTAEQWLVKCGYTSTQLIVLLDLESRLKEKNKTSDKMVQVREWLNQILATFSQTQEPQQTWPLPPCSFEEASQQALFLLV